MANMANMNNPGVMEESIRRAMVDTIERIFEEEASAAAERIRSRCKEIAPQVTMAVFRMFEVEQMRDRLVITVKNQLVDEKRS